jgi:transcriptional regulator with XRE-family HTH domain
MEQPERDSSEGFGALLRRLRERRGLSQSALARSVGLSASTVNMLEAEVRNSSRETALALAQALDLDPVDTDDLLLAGTHLPSSYARLDPAGRALVRDVTSLLTDPEVSDARRGRFTQLVQLALGLCRTTAG